MIAAPEQRRQRQHPEGDDGRPDNAGGRAHQYAEQDDADAHAAAQAAREMADHVHQLVGDARFVQRHPHEHE